MKKQENAGMEEMLAIMNKAMEKEKTDKEKRLFHQLGTRTSKVERRARSPGPLFNALVAGPGRNLGSP